MLVQFMVKNFLSFKDETILDMTAVNAYKEHEYNLINYNDKEKFLRVAAIYGANASGKSNLYLAVSCFQEIVAKSFNNVNDDGKTAIAEYYAPFLFDQDETNAEFQIIEILGDFEYKYGFEYNDKKVVSEWMYRKNLSTNRNTVIFERAESSVELGAAVRRECDIYKKQIPAETLALSFYNKLKLKTDIFREVYAGIMDLMVVPTSFYEDKEILKKFLPKVIDRDKNKLVEFLSAIDTGIHDIYYITDEKDIRIYTTHIGSDEKKYSLNLFSESEGTQRSIIIFINAQVAVFDNLTMFVDELNIKLHPLLLKLIIDLFYNENSTAQLVYTTHDTTLLDKKFFRRDQILFVQKDEYGHSELMSLSDFKVRSDASFEKDYLAGVYGGIPRIKDFEMGADN
ncbi:MAG: ATP-binding protein [Lachnospiraceae bacterium]|nr:ATP-binding protein [Lachnospiraceae bacterium]